VVRRRLSSLQDFADVSRRRMLTAGFAVGLSALRRGARDSGFGLVIGVALAGCGRSRPRATPVPRGATVLALGDSLTYGSGAPPEAAYPEVLAGLTGWSVVNAGAPGETSAQALQRLAPLLDEHRPALVLVGLGGNDFLRRLDPSETRGHLRQIGAASRAAGAQVLLIAIPRPTAIAAVVGALDDHPLYAELAEEMTLPLHPHGWSEVLGNARLRSDAIHANAEGYAQFARGLLRTLQEVGLWRG
jgi:acyl-CoA hydrolase